MNWTGAVRTIIVCAILIVLHFTLRPLLVELGASVPTKGMSFLTPAMDDAPALVDAWVRDQEHVLRSLSAGPRDDAG